MYRTWGRTKKYSPEQKRLGTFSYGKTCKTRIKVRMLEIIDELCESHVTYGKYVH